MINNLLGWRWADDVQCVECDKDSGSQAEMAWDLFNAEERNYEGSSEGVTPF